MSPGGVDATVLRRHLLALDAALSQLRQHAGRPAHDLTSDTNHRWAVERGLQLCVQNVLDIATHIAAAAGHDVPDYASALDALGRIGVVPAGFARRIRGLAGFRNVLVHGYLEVDSALVHKLLNERLADFVEFGELAEAWLSEG